MARTALATDAAPVVLTRARATGLGDAAPGGLRTLFVVDRVTGDEHEVRTRLVVDATGAWAAEADHPFSSESLRIQPSRGAHVVVPRERIPMSAGLTIRVPGKVVFLVPWPDHWVIGTTDAPYTGPFERPVADGWEVDELLATVNGTLDVDLERTDVVGTYAGLRPLIAPSGGSTVKASREHRVTVESNGVVRIGGGKYTTYRVMARRRDRCRPRARGSAAAAQRNGRAPAGRGGRCRCTAAARDGDRGAPGRGRGAP